MKKILLVIAIVLCAVSGAHSEAVDINHFMVGPSVSGEGGFIYNPSAYILDYGKFSLGLHKFLFKINYGFFEIIEAGLGFDFSDSSDLVEVFKGGDLNLKIRVLKEEDQLVSVAAGIERLPLNLVDDVDWSDFKLYFVASKKMWDMNFTLGGKNTVADNKIDLMVWHFFVDISRVINDIVLAIVEYDGERFNTGFKVSINYNISIEAFVADIGGLGDVSGIGEFLSDHFIFGITFIQ